MPPGKPAWQQLAEMGISGQGSAPANKAMLAEKLGGMPPGGPGGDPGAMPMPGAGGAGPGDDPAMRTFPGFKPRGLMSGGGPPSGPIAMPMPGPAPAGMPGLDPNSVMDTAPPGGGGFEALGRVGARLGGLGPSPYNPGNRPPRQVPANFASRLD